MPQDRPAGVNLTGYGAVRLMVVGVLLRDIVKANRAAAFKASAEYYQARPCFCMAVLCVLSEPVPDCTGNDAMGIPWQDIPVVACCLWLSMLSWLYNCVMCLRKTETPSHCDHVWH